MRPHQAWYADITYLPMRGGFMYLTVVFDGYSLKVLGECLSNTLDTENCLSAIERALAATGRRPEIMNTDQSCPFTSAEWIERVRAGGTWISMDGKGRWRDNIVVERFRRSLKPPETETITVFRPSVVQKPGPPHTLLSQCLLWNEQTGRE